MTKIFRHQVSLGQIFAEKNTAHREGASVETPHPTLTGANAVTPTHCANPTGYRIICESASRSLDRLDHIYIRSVGRSLTARLPPDAVIAAAYRVVHEKFWAATELRISLFHRTLVAKYNQAEKRNRRLTNHKAGTQVQQSNAIQSLKHTNQFSVASELINFEWRVAIWWLESSKLNFSR